jgi:hypothetical protein
VQPAVLLPSQQASGIDTSCNNQQSTRALAHFQHKRLKPAFINTRILHQTPLQHAKPRNVGPPAKGGKEEPSKKGWKGALIFLNV